MTGKGRVAKKYRPFLKAARKHGATVVPGTKHLKVFDTEGLVAVLPYGTRQFEGPGDLALLRKLWRERGWIQ